jgi:hypothetical protein
MLLKTKVRGFLEKCHATMLLIIINLKRQCHDVSDLEGFIGGAAREKRLIEAHCRQDRAYDPADRSEENRGATVVV